MKTGNHELDAELEEIAALPDDEIDCNDIPEVTGFDTKNRGRFYNPGEKIITLRLDSDIVDWLTINQSKYSNAINQTLRKFITHSV